MGFRKISTKLCAQLHVFSLWWLTWAFDETWKNFHKTCAQLHVLFAVETILSFEWGFEKFRQKCVPSYTFSQRRLSWVFEGTWKVSTKRCDQLHIFFAVQTILSFWWDLESFDKKLWPVAPFWQYRLSQVFDGTWKNVHKEVSPVTRFVRCGDYLKFWMRLRKVSTKMCAQLHVFAAQAILSFWGDLESFDKKMWPVTHFFRRADYLEFLMGLGKFRQKAVTSCTFLAVQTIASFWWDLEKFSQRSVPSYTFCSLWRLS